MRLIVETADFKQPDQAEKFTKWAFKTEGNLFDPDVMFYPTTNTLVVKDDAGEPLLFGPFQATITLESLAPRPGLSPLENARALKKFMQGIVAIAQHMGIREVNFICKDESLVEFLEDREFELIKHPVLRVKVPGPAVPPVSQPGVTT